MSPFNKFNAKHKQQNIIGCVNNLLNSKDFGWTGYFDEIFCKIFLGNMDSVWRRSIGPLHPRTEAGVGQDKCPLRNLP